VEDAIDVAFAEFDVLVHDTTNMWVISKFHVGRHPPARNICTTNRIAETFLPTAGANCDGLREIIGIFVKHDPCAIVIFIRLKFNVEVDILVLAIVHLP
jgi:hypothetical protein